MTTNAKIQNVKCPDCGSNIDVNELMVQKISDSLNKEYLKKSAELDKKEGEFKNRKDKENEIIAAKLLKLKGEQKKIIYADIKSEIEKENLQKIKSYQNELDFKSKQIQRFRGLEAELEKTKREVDETYSMAVSKLSKKHVADLRIEIKKAEERAKEDHELKIRELEKMLDNQKILTQEQKRKLDQGSQQLQGEIQEEAIEEWLINSFPFDRIDEISKGLRGADCIQTINTRNNSNCGKIYYESKNTASFNNSWISKFKKDMQEKSVDVGVLVTKSYPKGIERMTIVDGIYICSFDEFKGLSQILRNVIVNYSKLKILQENKGDKKEMLYNYLTSNEFNSNMENFFDAIEMINANLTREKKQILINFQKRRASYDLIQTNASEIYGRFNGISGSKIQQLENFDENDDSQINTVELLNRIGNH